MACLQLRGLHSCAGPSMNAASSSLCQFRQTSFIYDLFCYWFRSCASRAHWRSRSSRAAFPPASPPWPRSDVQSHTGHGSWERHCSARNVTVNHTIVNPFAPWLLQVRDAGNLLTRAGLAIPAVDVDEIIMRYTDPARLVAHVRVSFEGFDILMPGQLCASRSCSTESLRRA